MRRRDARDKRQLLIRIALAYEAWRRNPRSEATEAALADVFALASSMDQARMFQAERRVNLERTSHSRVK
jgi:hypothetical protein